MPLEKPVLPLPRRPWSDFGAVYAGNAFVAFLFAASAPVAIILSVGARGGLSESDLASWIFAVVLSERADHHRLFAALPAAAGVLLDHSRHGAGRTGAHASHVSRK